MNLYEINFDNPDGVMDTFQVMVIAATEAEAIERAKTAMHEEGRDEYKVWNVIEHDMTKPVVHFTGV